MTLNLTRQRASLAGTGLLLLAGLLLTAAPAAAQTGEDALRFTQRFPATGARMLGMGGAVGAGVADYSAFLSNPAGLALFERSQITGSLSTLSTTESSLYQTPGFSTADEQDVRATQLGHFAYLHKVPTVRGSLVVGAAYNQVASFERNFLFEGLNNTSSISESFLPYADEYEVGEDDAGYFPRFFGIVPELAYFGGAIEFLPEEVPSGNYPFYEAVTPGTRIMQYGDVVEEGRMSELNFGGAAEAAPGVMVGLSANLIFGRYRFDSVYEEVDEFDENTEDMYQVFLDDGDLLGFDALVYEEGFESSLVGINVRAGLSARLTRELRLGLSMETPSYYSVNEDYSRELNTYFDVGGSLGDSQSGEFEYDITTPWRMGAGLAYDAGTVLVSADVEYVDWSQLELDASSDRAYFDDVNRDIRTSFDPVFNTRLGAEFRLGDLALRGGFAFQPDPRQEEIEFESGRTDRSKTFFSAGVGYRFSNQLQVDLGWMQERFDDLYVPYGDVQATPPVVEEEVVRNRFAVGLKLML